MLETPSTPQAMRTSELLREVFSNGSLLVKRQLKAKRLGTAYYRLPPLETLDRLTTATLTVAFAALPIQ